MECSSGLQSSAHACSAPTMLLLVLAQQRWHCNPICPTACCKQVSADPPTLGSWL
jgi:hypothetical protein